MRAGSVGCMLAVALASCKQGPSAQGASWPEADAMFSHDPLWLGSDGAYSCDLGSGRVLWLFGDTLIAKDATRNRNTAYFIHNSLAIQTGYDPSQAFIEFYWGQLNGAPNAYFPQQGNEWFWPGICARVGQGLIVFAGPVVNTGASGPFNFMGEGDGAFFIADADTDPSSWQPADAHPPNFGASLSLGTAGMINGDYLYVYGTRDASNDYVIARFNLSDVAAGDLSQGEFFTGGQWVAGSAMSGLPDPIFTVGAPESSVNWEPSLNLFLMTQSEGFGATTLAFRSAPNPEGPWSEPTTFFRPPESYETGAFVYAGKGHPELQGADFVATYVATVTTGTPPPEDYYPRFVKVTFE